MRAKKELENRVEKPLLDECLLFQVKALDSRVIKRCNDNECLHCGWNKYENMRRQKYGKLFPCFDGLMRIKTR